MWLSGSCVLFGFILTNQFKPTATPSCGLRGRPTFGWPSRPRRCVACSQSLASFSRFIFTSVFVLTQYGTGCERFPRLCQYGTIRTPIAPSGLFPFLRTGRAPHVEIGVIFRKRDGPGDSASDGPEIGKGMLKVAFGEARTSWICLRRKRENLKIL